MANSTRPPLQTTTMDERSTGFTYCHRYYGAEQYIMPLTVSIRVLHEQRSSALWNSSLGTITLLVSILDQLSTLRQLVINITSVFKSSVLVIALILLLSTPLNAQETSEKVYELEKVVVTATKREDSLQEIPVSVTALDGETLNDLGFWDSDNIAAQVPNLQWRSDFGTSSPTIFLRGIGNISFHTNAIGSVGVYNDGVYQGSNIVQGFPLFDLERVEVLRGSQGTVFGRNTTGGLVNFISRKPDVLDGYNGRVAASYGSFDLRLVDAAIGFPINETTAGRLAFVYRAQDGIFNNVNSSSGFDEAGNPDVKAFRAQLRYQPHESLDVLLNVHGLHNNSDLRPYKQVGVVCPTGVKPGLGSACTDYLGQRDSPDFHESLDNLKTHDELNALGGNLQQDWHLGDYILTSISAFDHAELERFEDTDHQPSSQFHSSHNSKVDFWSQELRIATNNDSPTQWLAGLYYAQDKLDQWEAFDTNDLFNVANPGAGVLFGTPVPEGVASKIHQETQSFAIFAELTHAFSKRWELTAGVRLTYDERNVDIEALGWDASTTRNQFISETTARELILFNTIPRKNVKKSWLEPSGKLALSYAIDDDQRIYVTGSRGFKGGEFNGGALFDSAEANLTDPEFVTGFELGYKSRLLNGRLQFNASAFYMEYDDQQVFILASRELPLQALANAGGSEIKGIEAELHWLLGESWSFQLGVGYLDARFSDFIDPLNPANNFSGNRLVQAPEWSVNGLVQYDWPFELGLIRAQTDFFWASKRFFTTDNNENLTQEAYGIVNSRLAFISPDHKYEAAIWVKNLLDKDYFTGGFDVEAFGFNGFQVGDPRTIGLTLAVNF